MVWIAPGEFTMGSPDTERNRNPDEDPQTKVAISRGFWLGKCDVTQAQWKAEMGTTINQLFAKFCAEMGPVGGAWTFPGEGDSRPMSCMTWEEAMEFCRKLTQRERKADRLPEDWEYTLPTEAQWEYACRAGTTGAYAGDLNALAWFAENSGDTTHPVGQKQPNAWGLYDMHGNVWEWCRDWYADKLPGGAITDPVGATSGTLRVRRGGCWWFPAGRCRSAIRRGLEPGRRRHDVGFRLALSAVRQDGS
jgi:formylglycine-generating enzyme required for sulfatase activity